MKKSAVGLMRSAVTLTAALGVASIASADAETWFFDVTTSGEDVFWTSPTAVDPTAPRYLAEYEITLIEATGTVFGFPVTENVTDEVPEEDRIGSEILDGPLPLVLLDDQVVYPEPPEEPSVAALVFIELDANGFGQLSVTEVKLNTFEAEVPPFGTVTVNLTSVRMAGTITITPLGPLGDLTGDGSVGVSDLLLLLSTWGNCADPKDCPEDLTGDGSVGVSDLLILLSNWG